MPERHRHCVPGLEDSTDGLVVGPVVFMGCDNGFTVHPRCLALTINVVSPSFRGIDQLGFPRLHGDGEGLDASSFSQLKPRSAEQWVSASY
eukprot:1136216-Amphidinium_carterae.2